MKTARPQVAEWNPDGIGPKKEDEGEIPDQDNNEESDDNLDEMTKRPPAAQDLFGQVRIGNA